MLFRVGQLATSQLKRTAATTKISAITTGTSKRLLFTKTQERGNMASKITDWVHPDDKSGEFKRGVSQFRDFVKKGGEFPPEAERYHLYVSYACPWAHRTLITRRLKGLEKIIPYTAVHWHMGGQGWRFATPEDDDAPGEEVTADPVPGHKKYTHLRELYFGVDPEYKGRFTVPVLFDKKQGRIVSNESSEIIRMFYTEFDDLLEEKYKSVNLFPKEFQSQIDESNDWIYNTINNGVYKSGFATTQTAYESAVTQLFTSLDKVESHLAKVHASGGKYMYGRTITESDIRLFTTIIRFDPVYVQHFKTNIRDIRSGYPHIHRWVRELYWGEKEAFGEGTTQFVHIKRHYTRSHGQINPYGITPVGPLPDILPLEEEVRAVEKK